MFAVARGGKRTSDASACSIDLIKSALGKKQSHSWTCTWESQHVSYGHKLPSERGNVQSVNLWSPFTTSDSFQNDSNTGKEDLTGLVLSDQEEGLGGLEDLDTRIARTTSIPRINLVHGLGQLTIAKEFDLSVLDTLHSVIDDKALILITVIRIMIASQSSLP